MGLGGDSGVTFVIGGDILGQNNWSIVSSVLLVKLLVVDYRAWRSFRLLNSYLLYWGISLRGNLFPEAFLCCCVEVNGRFQGKEMIQTEDGVINCLQSLRFDKVSN